MQVVRHEAIGVDREGVAGGVSAQDVKDLAGNCMRMENGTAIRAAGRDEKPPAAIVVEAVEPNRFAFDRHGTGIVAEEGHTEVTAERGQKEGKEKMAT